MPSTVSSYKCVLAMPLNIDLADCPFPQILKGMWNKRPSLPCREPDWCLDLVLEFLSSDCFTNSTFVDLACRCVFLFTLATASRVSEVHSILRDNQHVIFGQNFGFVKIVSNVNLLAKNELPAALKVRGLHSPVCLVKSLFCNLLVQIG